MRAVIYTRSGCTASDMAKTLCENNGLEYDVLEVGKDLINEEFNELYPASSTPLVFVDGQKIGGYANLVEWFNTRPKLIME